MPTINDYKKATLKKWTGVDGDINTLESKWLKSLVSPYTGAIPDMWRKYLVSLGYTDYSLDQKAMKYLGDRGYTGSITNRWYQYWKNGGVAAETAALTSRFTTPPTNTRMRLIDNLIISLKKANVWSKLDAFYMLAAADTQSSLLNWVSTSYNLTAVNSPAFVVDRGYTGDGSTSYLETSFNPTTAVGAKFTQNSASQGLWSLTNLANAGASSFDMGNTSAQIDRQGVVAGQAVGRSNTGAGIVIAPGAYPGDASWSRTASNVWEGYAQGIDAGGGTDASAAMTNASFRILSVTAAAFGVNQIASADWGSGMTAAERLAIKSARQIYLQAVGAV